MSDNKPSVIQPCDIFKTLGIPDHKDTEDSEKVLRTILSFLVHLRVDSSLKTNNLTFTKISHDLIHIESSSDLKDLVNSLSSVGGLVLPL